jgi:peptide/nickel transport system permease protein
MAAVGPDATIDPGVAAGIEPGRSEAQRARRELWGQLFRSKTLIVGGVILLWWVLCAFIGDQIAPKDPLALGPDLWHAPSSEYWFGTDQLGRDVFSRVLAGSRDILIVATGGALLGVVLGTVLGLITGYFRGKVDDVASRLIEAVLAIPTIIVAVACIVALGSRSHTTIIIIIGALYAPIVSRTVRSAVLSERELEYVQAARLRGERSPYVLGAEILPNVMAPIIVETTVRLGYAVFTVAGLTFLGFGLQPPSPDWALQVSENYTTIDPNWWTVLFPGLAIASLVVAVNLIADGITQVIES